MRQQSLHLSSISLSLCCSTLEEQSVVGQEYCECLSELVNVCVLCNDSGLAYNEV